MLRAFVAPYKHGALATVVLWRLPLVVLEDWRLDLLAVLGGFVSGASGLGFDDVLAHWRDSKIPV